MHDALRNPQDNLAPIGISAISDRQLAAMILHDLPAENETNSGPRLLGCIERDEQIFSSLEADAPVADQYLQVSSRGSPGDDNRALQWLGVGYDQHSVCRVLDQVDEGLLHLVGVHIHTDGWTTVYGHG